MPNDRELPSPVQGLSPCRGRWHADCCGSGPLHAHDLANALGTGIAVPVRLEAIKHFGPGRRAVTPT